MAEHISPTKSKSAAGWLGWLERVGNRLPDPATLFLIGTVMVMIASAVAAKTDWIVEERLPAQTASLDQPAGASVKWEATGKTYHAKNILTRDGLFWAISSMVKNFINFAPLGIVLVGMLGIGIAERTGFIGSALKAMLMVVPKQLLTPAVVFMGLLAGLANGGAQVIDPSYQLNPACNWWFMIASTVIMTGVGWFVADGIVEKRLAGKSPDEGGSTLVNAGDLMAQKLSLEDWRALKISTCVFIAGLMLVLALIMIPGSPLYTYQIESPTNPGQMVAAEVVELADGQASPKGSVERDGLLLMPSANIFPRWVKAIVPLVFIVFIIPGIVYGVVVKKIRSDRDVTKLLTDSMAGMASIIVMAFFAGQFIEHFKYSGLDKMLAMTGGQALGQTALPTSLLLVAFILMTMCFNMFVGSMSAKYTMFAPIFIPMFMMVGIAPELTQCAYRIGDSVTNCITPLNPYMVIMLAFMKNIAPKGGMGTLISTMLPFTIVFSIVWTFLLLVWVWLGIPLGPDGHLVYPPPG